MPSKLVFNSVIAIKRIKQGRIAKTDTFNNLTGVNMPILNGKKVVDLEVDGVDSRDFPDFADAYFSSGCYEDGTPLTEDELNKLTDLAGDVLWTMAYESFH
jgi:hypothetical protein